MKPSFLLAAILVAAPLSAQHVATDQQEIALGAALVNSFNQTRGVVPQSPEDLRIQSYLQGVADSLGKHTRRKLPGGHIVVWGGALAYMSYEDELAAIIAHEMEHQDDDQVPNRIDSLVHANNLDVNDASKWNWRWFGASQGVAREALCDYKGAKLMVETGYSPRGYDLLLQSYVVLSDVHTPEVDQKVIKDRIAQIRAEITEMHWENLTKVRPLRLP
jgi:Peptidase family M48